jgi:hypothetical protein
MYIGHCFLHQVLCCRLWHQMRRPRPTRFTAMLPDLASRYFFIRLDSRCFCRKEKMAKNTLVLDSVVDMVCRERHGEFGPAWKWSGAVAAAGDNRGTAGRRPETLDLPESCGPVTRAPLSDLTWAGSFEFLPIICAPGPGRRAAP